MSKREQWRDEWQTLNNELERTLRMLRDKFGGRAEWKELVTSWENDELVNSMRSFSEVGDWFVPSYGRVNGDAQMQRLREMVSEARAELEDLAAYRAGYIKPKHRVLGHLWTNGKLYV
jgi:hypothetical protein